MKFSNQITNKKTALKIFSNLLPDSMYLENVTKHIPLLHRLFSISKEILKLEHEFSAFL